MASPSALPGPGPRRARRLRWLVALALCVIFLDLQAQHRLARPLGLIRHSADPEIIYENVPGSYVGRPTYDVWKAPLYMVWDMIRTDAAHPPARLPPGSTLYRIDRDGCRGASEGPLYARADVIVAGSSQAFGMLVSAENSVPGMLERSLRARGFGGLRVANCSVVGHRFRQTLRTVERAQRAKQPRLVVVLVRPWHLTEPFPYADVMAPRNRLHNWLIQHSGLARLAHFFAWRNSPHPAPLSRERVASGLDAYARDLGAAGVPSLFVLLDDRAEDRPALDALAEQLRARGLGVERVRTPSGPDAMFIDHDRHWSVRGGAYTTAQLLDPVVRALEASGVAPSLP